MADKPEIDDELAKLLREAIEKTGDKPSEYGNCPNCGRGLIKLATTLFCPDFQNCRFKQEIEVGMDCPDCKSPLRMEGNLKICDLCGFTLAM